MEYVFEYFGRLHGLISRVNTRYSGGVAVRNSE